MRLLAVILLASNAFAAHSIDLAWDASSTAGVTYTVKRASIFAGPYSNLATGLSVRTFTDGGLNQNTQFCYQVVAVFSNIQSVPSNSVCSTTLADSTGLPGAPTNLRAVGVR